MTHVTPSSLHNEPFARLLMLLQLASSALQIAHQVLPKARLLAVAHVVDASTLLLAPSADVLADVHQAVATGLSQMKIEQARRCADICNASTQVDVSEFQPVE